MTDALHELAGEIAKDLAETTGLPVCVSDRSGKVLVSTGETRSFCPLVAYEGQRAPPLPSRCEQCPRVDALLAGEGAALPPCPHGEDTVRPITIGGWRAGWLVTSVMPKEFGRAAVERAERAFKLAELPLAAAIAAERRDRFKDDRLSQKLLVASIRTERALERLAPDAPARHELELARQALDQAIDVIYAFRAVPTAAAEVAAAAADQSSTSAPEDEARLRWSRKCAGGSSPDHG